MWEILISQLNPMIFNMQMKVLKICLQLGLKVNPQADN